MGVSRNVSVLLIAVAAQLLMSRPAPAKPRAAIHDCDSFRAWFRKQPGSQLTLGVYPYRVGQGPAPRGGSDQFPVASVEETYFRGLVGGGGCMGGYYDAEHHAATIIEQYDTAQEYTETLVATVPEGIRSGWVPAPTLNGVALGMSLHEIEAREGVGLHYRHGAYMAVSYSWTLANNRQIGYSLKFLLVNDRVVAMDFIYGA
jgi:hypothetical protein